MRNIFFVFTDWFVRFSYLLTGPDYFEESGMFKISPPQLAVSPGDIVYFLADQVCHRAPPPSVGGTRRVVFWFSWEDTGEECSVPDVDFQLNPWTLYQLIHSPNDFQNHYVSTFFLFLLIFLIFSSFVEISLVSDGMDGLLSIPPLP